MNIAVYLGSSMGNDPKYSELTQSIGQWICKHQNTLVYGAGSKGQMGLLADTVYQGKGKIIGVMPRFLLKIEKLYDHLDEEYMVDTMSQRKQKMIDLAQGFIALPGGPGTLEEITEIISLVRLDQLPYPCVLYNLDGYYDTLKQQLDVMIKEGFLDAEGIKNVHFFTSLEQLDALFGY